MTAAARVAAAGAGLVADRLLHEPPDRWHPVAWFGRAMQHLERLGWADRRGAGVRHAAAGVALGVLAGRTLERVAGAAVGTSIATEVATGGRMLTDVASRIGERLAAGDGDGARAALPSLVGRDPSALDESGIARAVVESVAENTVDAVVAPAVWAALLGAPGVLAHRAINTMDAMVGHRSPRYERFGWAPARLDDAANWLPARLTALAVVILRPRRAAAVWTAVREGAPQHPSPNGGVVEAAFAAALDVRLGGRNRYGARVEDRGVLHPGGRTTGPADVTAAVQLSRQVTWLVAGLCAAAALGIASTGARHTRG